MTQCTATCSGIEPCLYPFTLLHAGSAEPQFRILLHLLQLPQLFLRQTVGQTKGDGLQQPDTITMRKIPTRSPFDIIAELALRAPRFRHLTNAPLGVRASRQLFSPLFTLSSLLSFCFRRERGAPAPQFSSISGGAVLSQNTLHPRTCNSSTIGRTRASSWRA